MRTKIDKKLIAKTLSVSVKSVYNYIKEERPIIFLLDKYFTDEDLEEFLETSIIERLEPNKKNYSSHKITEMEERISFLESIILEQNHINEETMAEYANVPIEIIQDWKINKPELIATIIQSLIKKGEKQ